MKSVGILTFYLNHNYGSTLQCYALKTAIEKISGYKVHVISHTFVSRIENGFGEQYLYEKYNKRIAMFDDFLKHEIGCDSEHISKLTAENAPEYDYYVVGSDVVWDTALTNSDGAFFLDFAEDMDKVKIAYAPSLNGGNTNKLNKKLFQDYIDKFDFLSIRETVSIEYIKKFTDKDVCRTLDPTFLLSSNQYLKLIDKKRIKQKGYILLYIIYENTENIQKIVNYVNRISLERDLEVIHFIYNIPDYVFGDRGRSFAFDGPKDFLWYVYNADLIITNSFHGIAFSVIFRKPFYAMERPGGETKIKSILMELGLTDRIFHNEVSIEEVSFALDYSKTEIKLAQLISQSYDFLAKSLGVNWEQNKEALNEL